MLGGHARIRLTEPLGYRDMVTALQHAELILTDSGGIQEEAPTFQKPVLVMREVTERPEATQLGIARLVGTDADAIERCGTAVLDGGGWRALVALHESETAPSLGTPAPEGKPLPGRHTTVQIEEDLSAGVARARMQTLTRYPNPYGDGLAGERIADIVIHELAGPPRRTLDWEGPS